MLLKLIAMTLNRVVRWTHEGVLRMPKNKKIVDAVKRGWPRPRPSGQPHIASCYVTTQRTTAAGRRVSGKTATYGKATLCATGPTLLPIAEATLFGRVLLY
jgi:hypothetical protein